MGKLIYQRLMCVVSKAEKCLMKKPKTETYSRDKLKPDRDIQHGQIKAKQRDIQH